MMYESRYGRSSPLAAGFAALALTLPPISTAAPNGRSVPETIQACQPEGTETARVCSTKELSNVVVQCTSESGTFFVKYDDLDRFEAPHQDQDFSLETAYLGDFSCPAGSTLDAVFIKSGSPKYDGSPIGGLPRGSGVMWSFATCPVDCAIPTNGEAAGEEEEEEEGTGTLR